MRTHRIGRLCVVRKAKHEIYVDEASKEAFFVEGNYRIKLAIDQNCSDELNMYVQYMV